MILVQENSDSLKSVLTPGMCMNVKIPKSNKILSEEQFSVSLFIWLDSDALPHP